MTFLLTDIEGSTPLLHALGDRYAAVLTEVRTHTATQFSRLGVAKSRPGPTSS